MLVKMEYLIPLFLIIFTFNGIHSEAFPSGSAEELPERLLCNNYCHHQDRVCLQPPYSCGSCKPGYRMLRDGLCQVSERGEHHDNPENNDIRAKGINEEGNALDDIAASRVQSVRKKGMKQERGNEENPNNSNDVSTPSDQTIDMKVHTEHLVMPEDSTTNTQTIFLVAVVAGCSIAGLVGLVVAGVCWYRLQKNVKAASEAEYPAYGVTGPNPEKVGSPGDRKLAQSAQMYHYQHQKQQMIAMEKANGEMNKDGSEADSEEENEEGDYTVYECPGLAPTGEMEVKNPLFSEETPVTPSGGDLPQGHK